MAIRHPGQFDSEFHAPALFDPEVTTSGLFDGEWEARATATSSYVPYDIAHTPAFQTMIAG